MSRKRYYVKHLTTRQIIGVFFAILIFVLAFPFFALNLRYQFGGIFSTLIDGIGTFSLAIGGVYMLVGVLGMFTRSHGWIKNVIIGVVLLWIGCWCTGAVIDFWLFTIGDSESSGNGGYY